VINLNLNQPSSIWWLASGITLMIVLLTYAPKWGGWLLLLIVLGYLLIQGSMGGRVLLS